MKKNLQMFIFLMLIWIILNETVVWYVWLIGIGVCIYSVHFTNQFLKSNYAEAFYVRPFKFIKYAVYIVIEIFKAGFDMLMRVMTGDVEPTFVEYESELTTDLANVVLANSITSTPGTITIGRDQRKFFVLSANPDAESFVEGTRTGMEPEVAKAFEPKPKEGK